METGIVTWKKKCDFKDILNKDKTVSKYLSFNELDELFNLKKILKNINKIYKRIGL